MFGTEAVPRTKTALQQLFGDELYQIYYRFLETQPEYFGFAPAAYSAAGRWCIYGLGLPDDILHQMYSENAARLMGIELKIELK